MQTKISIFWVLLAIGFIVHHIYGLFGVYYHESVMMEGADGTTPSIHHIYRMLFEGMALIFAALSLELTKVWFKWLALIWAVLGAIFNVYHLVASFMYEATNYAEILILIWMIGVSIGLIFNLNKWRRSDDFIVA